MGRNVFQKLPPNIENVNNIIHLKKQIKNFLVNKSIVPH